MSLKIVMAIIILSAVIISLAIIFADMLGWIRIRREYQRKALFSSVLLEIVGLFLLVARAELLGDDGKAQPVADPPVAHQTVAHQPVKPPLPRDPIRPDGTDVSKPKPPDATDRPDEADEYVCASPVAICAWAAENLPARPYLPVNLDKVYPACASSLRALDISDVTKPQAQSCFDDLGRFNQQVLLDYQNKFYPYTGKLAELSQNQGDPDRLKFMQDDYASFTGFEGAEFMRFRAASNRFGRDFSFFARLK